MKIKDILARNLGINRLTGPSLEESIIHHFNNLPNRQKRRINREIAHYAIKTVKTSRAVGDYLQKGNPRLQAGTNVLGINHSGPLDVTIEWETAKDGTLEPVGCHIHSGGDQINVAKVFSAFGRDIALVALAGKAGSEITSIWEKNFLNENIISTLIRVTGDQQIAVMNMVDGRPLPPMFEWAEELSAETVHKINRQSLDLLKAMFKGDAETVWIVISAGGPLKYNRDLSYYGTLVRQIKDIYHEKTVFLLDFKHISGPEEAMSVLDIPRETPQDIIKPNLEEFIQLLAWSGLTATGTFEQKTISDKTVKEYALKLRSKYNLLGVLVSMDRSGLMLVLEDRVIREKGIKIKPACHTAAGDSLKAGFLYALSSGRSFEDAVHTGNLFGAATASMEGSATVTPEKFAETEAMARKQNVKPETEYLA